MGIDHQQVPYCKMRHVKILLVGHSTLLHKLLSGKLDIQSVVKRLKEVVGEKCDLIVKDDLGSMLMKSQT